jgi:hypothetical protein
MTPPLIDQRGFVLGQVNIIDALAVQLVAAVAAAGVSFVAPDSATLWAAGIIAADLAALWVLSRAPEPTPADEPDEPSDAPNTPADDSPPVVTLELPNDEYDVNVRVRGATRADGGQEVDR